MHKVLSTVLGGLTLLVASAAFAEAPTHVYIRDIGYAGSGCPAGSVSEYVAADRDALLIDFDSFVAERGPWVGITEGRKICTLSIDLAYPDGWSYAVHSVDIDGYVSLAPGARGAVTTAAYFQGSAATGRLSTPFYGPTDRDFDLRHAYGDSATVWSPCGARRALILSLQAQVTGRSSGLLALDSPFDLGHSVRIKWRRCR